MYVCIFNPSDETKLNVPAMITGHDIETCIVILSFLLFAVQSSKSLNFWLYIDNTIYL